MILYQFRQKNKFPSVLIMVGFWLIYKSHVFKFPSAICWFLKIEWKWPKSEFGKKKQFARFWDWLVNTIRAFKFPSALCRFLKIIWKLPKSELVKKKQFVRFWDWLVFGLFTKSMFSNSHQRYASLWKSHENSPNMNSAKKNNPQDSEIGWFLAD